MSNSMFRLRRSRSSALYSQQNSTTSLDDLLIPTGRSSSSSRTTLTVEPTDRTRILLDRLKALNSDIDKRIVQKDGVLVGTFILSMTDMLQQTVEYIENNVTMSEFLAFTEVQAKGYHQRSGNVANASGEYILFRDAIAAGFNEICTTIQTLRSNKQLIAKILHDVREYFRMVVRKVQKSPIDQENEELRRDVEGLFQNLQDVQKTVLKLRKRHGLRLVPFAKRNSDNLEAFNVKSNMRRVHSRPVSRSLRISPLSKRILLFA
ncbi:hypothetical protein BT96DRAFT_936948 [Gymnopus androsaceus JB14]|uniref:Uncharacterized protein n=1 Tax=Gymnopus androsaceus JB14 TaxID=1447944 RepID=A0A6A4I1K6_9AGAR|nr:hypothetical protein BT96DRAFT_936948 [Gymnopus androsaceus JB14]